MIIRDRETGTLWQQATGEALIGPLQGTQLEPLGGELTTWLGWKTQHPATSFALEPERWQGLVPKRKIVKLLETATKSTALPGFVPADHRLPFDAIVIGVVVDGKAKAYPLQRLAQAQVIHDSVGQAKLTVEFAPESDRVIVRRDGCPIHYQRTRWIGWYEFHPLTEL